MPEPRTKKEYVQQVAAKLAAKGFDVRTNWSPLDGKPSERGLDVPPPPDVHPDPEPDSIQPLLEQGEPEEPE